MNAYRQRQNAANRPRAVAKAFPLDFASALLAGLGLCALIFSLMLRAAA